MQIATIEGDIVLDSFADSGTTEHAALWGSQLAAWSVLDEAAVKASATSERPNSNKRLPRRDWQ